MQKIHRFRNTVRKYGGRAKTYAGAYGKDMTKSYGYGYKSGWDSYPKIPDRFGSGFFGAIGFNRGYSARRQVKRSGYNYKRYSK